MQIIEITYENLGVLAFFMALGYFLSKKKLVSENTASALSGLEMYLLLPALICQTFIEKCNVESLLKTAEYVKWGVIIVAINLVVSYSAARFFDKDKGTLYDVIAYSVAFPNTGYIGCPLVLAMFGQDMLFKVMMIIMPINLVVYTLGIYQLNPYKKLTLKNIINPVLAATLIGIIIGLIRIPIHPVLNSTLTSASNCVAPCAMMLTGMVIARYKLSNLFKSGKMYFIASLRNIFCPALIFALVYFLGIRGELLIAAMAVSAMPMGLNSVIAIESFGGNPAPGAQASLISNLMAMISVPVLFYIATVLA